MSEQAGKVDQKVTRRKVIDLARWRARRLEIQSQEDYIHKLCERCGTDAPPCCGEEDLRRLVDIQRLVILDMLDGGRAEGEEPKDGQGPRPGSAPR
jgi:hypothetical protein